MRKILGIFIMTLLIGTSLPAIGTINGNITLFMNESNDSYNTDQKHFIIASNQGTVLWDNGMYFSRMGRMGAFNSQWDSIDLYDAIGAADFQFEITTEITGVNWIGGYGYPGEDGDFDWNVSFYMDRGDGMAPGDKIYEKVFPNTEVHEIFIEEKWEATWVSSYSVDLEDPVTFTGGEKYWISIQGVGNSPPESIWLCHFAVALHDLVWKCPRLGYRDWKSSTDIWYGNLLDCCFQLTGDGEPVVPDLECTGDIILEDVPPGAIVNSTFTVINNGDVGSMLGWEVLSYPDWGTNWSAKWIYKDWLIMTDGGSVGSTNDEEIILEVQVPNEKNQEFSGEIILVNIDNPDDTYTINVVCKTPRSKNMDQFQSFIERFIERFPILKFLI